MSEHPNWEGSTILVSLILANYTFAYLYHLDRRYSEHTQEQNDEKQSNRYQMAMCILQRDLRTKHGVK
jgi:hypothetical protein